jgi:hypothetical protein
MTPLIKLCTEFIPANSNSKRKSKILETALNKIQTSRCDFDQKYFFFEFAFMPITLQAYNNSELFKELFTPKLISQFLETFFKAEGNLEFWKLIQ